MKKYILLFFAIAVGFVACDVETDEEPGGTDVEEMTGEWTVTFEQSIDEYYYLFGYSTVDPDLDSKTAEELDTLSWSDLYGSGKVSVYTYNTASNSADSMWFADYAASSSDYTFWQYKIKVGANCNALTFDCETKANTSYDGCEVTVLGGRLFEDAATTPRGAVADSIVAYVKFSDDSNGFTYMKMSGYRYTGFDEDK